MIEYKTIDEKGLDKFNEKCLELIKDRWYMYSNSPTVYVLKDSVHYVATFSR